MRRDDEEDAPTACGICYLSLAPGATHRDLAACVEALRAALDDAQDKLDVSVTCDACGGEIGPHCPLCAIKADALKRVGNIGLDLFAKAQQKLTGKKRKRD